MYVMNYQTDKANTKVLTIVSPSKKGIWDYFYPGPKPFRWVIFDRKGRYDESFPNYEETQAAGLRNLPLKADILFFG